MKKEHGHSFGRASDAFLTHWIARSVSVRISPKLIKTSITPMQVTVIGLIVGLTAAAFGSSTLWTHCIVAAVLMEISHILDCIDGELARLTDRGNPFAAKFDPITDRVKDMAVIFASYHQAHQKTILKMSEFQIAAIAILTVGLWTLYMYIVDAYLNPAKKKIGNKRTERDMPIYFGLYDMFIYGSIIFWLFNVFSYFNIYVLIMAIAGVIIQLFRLKKILK